MPTGKANLTHQVEGFRKVYLGFTREPRDHIGGQSHFRDFLLDGLDE